MTVSIITSRADYTGNGVTTAFTVPFYFLDNTHLLVLRTQISTGVTTTLALTTDYSVSGAGVAAGGTITTVAVPTADQKISILRNVPFTQLVHYVPNDPFPAATHEQALDQLTMEVQQLNEVQSRSLTLSQASTGISSTLPNPQANLVLAWNAAANALTNVDASTLASSIVYGSTASQNNSGNGTTTQFTLGSNGTNVNNVQAYISGVRQRPGTDYTLSTDGVTINFTTAPASGTNNILFVWQQALPIAAVADNSITTAKLVDGSVTTAKHADASVTAAKLASGAAVSNVGTGGITSNELASGSVTAAKIASGAAVSNIGAGGITSNELASSSVTSAKIASGAAVSNIGAGGITSNELASNSVTTAKITDANVTAAKLASGAAVSNVGAGGITSNELASNAVTTAKITDANVTPAKLANGGAELGMRNRIINGGMSVSQYNGTSSVTPSSTAHVIDRFQLNVTQGSKITAQQLSASPPAGFSYYLGLSVAATATVGATDAFEILQSIEGLNAQDLAWGTANAKAVTLSAWVYSNVTGTFGGAIWLYGGSTSYPFSYSIPSANTWTQVSITIPGPTTGSWPTTSAGSIIVGFSLGAGTSKSGTAGTWASGTTYFSATGATSIMGSTSNYFYITGVQLEKGSTATPFEYRSYGTELALCQRYYWQLSGNGKSIGTIYQYISTQIGIVIPFPVTMRSGPSFSQGSGLSYFQFYRNNGTTTFDSWSFANSTTNAAELYNNTVASTGGLYSGNVVFNNANAFIAFSSEL